MAGQRQSTSVAVLASAAKTTTGSTAGVTVPEQAQRIAILADVTAVSGTSPNMVLSVEWSNDGTAWAVADTADAFTALTATGTVVKDFTVKGRQFRLTYTITGTTPSFTFSASAVGV